MKKISLLLAIMVLAVACGGGSKPPTPTPVPVATEAPTMAPLPPTEIPQPVATKPPAVCTDGEWLSGGVGGPNGAVCRLCAGGQWTDAPCPTPKPSPVPPIPPTAGPKPQCSPEGSIWAVGGGPTGISCSQCKNGKPVSIPCPLSLAHMKGKLKKGEKVYLHSPGE